MDKLPIHSGFVLQVAPGSYVALVGRHGVQLTSDLNATQVFVTERAAQVAQHTDKSLAQAVVLPVMYQHGKRWFYAT